MLTPHQWCANSNVMGKKFILKCKNSSLTNSVSLWMALIFCCRRKSHVISSPDDSCASFTWRHVRFPALAPLHVWFRAFFLKNKFCFSFDSQQLLPTLTVAASVLLCSRPEWLSGSVIGCPLVVQAVRDGTHDLCCLNASSLIST